MANVAPNASTIGGPLGGITVDLGLLQRFTWAFSDADPGDTQSAFDIQYRVIGAGSWTTVSVSSPNWYYDFPAGTFTANNYEWQIRTYDAIGVVGPWTASAFFTAAAAPASLAITAPLSGATVGATATFTWSAPAQTSYQIRKVRDIGGVPDTSTVYYDTGTVVDVPTRSVVLAFTTNNRYEHLQIRIFNSGLWSAWVSIRVLASYIQPSPGAVSIAADEATASLLVTTTAAAVGAGEPTPIYIDIYIREVGSSGFGDRVAAAVTPTGIWTYWTPKSGVSYEARTLTTGSNGAQRWSSLVFTHFIDGGAAVAPTWAFILDGGGAATTFTNSIDGGTA